jgi:hypothetical protein
MKIDRIINPNYKTGETNGKAWVMMRVQVGDKEANIFPPAAVGDSVTLTYNEKYKDWTARKDTPRGAVKKFEADPVKLKQEFNLEVHKNQSIQRQVAVKGVVDLIVAGKRDYAQLEDTYNDLMVLLNPKQVEIKPVETVTDKGDFAAINFEPDLPPVEVYDVQS